MALPEVAEGDDGDGEGAEERVGESTGVADVRGFAGADGGRDSSLI